MPRAALAPEDRARRRLEAVLAKAGVRVEVVAETPFSATVCEFAVLDMGIGRANSSAFAAGPARSVRVKDFESCLGAEIDAFE